MTDVSILGLGLLGGFSFWIMLTILWTIVWKGWALWIAARAGSKPWFIALLILNTVGILEILYIFIFSKKDVMKEFKEKEAEVVKEDAKEEESKSDEDNNDSKNNSEEADKSENSEEKN